MGLIKASLLTSFIKVLCPLLNILSIVHSDPNILHIIVHMCAKKVNTILHTYRLVLESDTYIVICAWS